SERERGKIRRNPGGKVTAPVRGLAVARPGLRLSAFNAERGYSRKKRGCARGGSSPCLSADRGAGSQSRVARCRGSCHMPRSGKFRLMGLGGKRSAGLREGAGR